MAFQVYPGWKIGTGIADFRSYFSQVYLGFNDHSGIVLNTTPILFGDASIIPHCCVYAVVLMPLWRLLMNFKVRPNLLNTHQGAFLE